MVSVKCGPERGGGTRLFIAIVAVGAVGMGVACGGQVAAPDGPDAARRPGDVPDAAGPSCKAGVSAVDISAGQGAGSGALASAAIDTAGSKLLVVTRNNADSDKPALFQCNLDGTGCVYTDLSAGQDAGSGFFPSAVMDTVGRQAALCHGQPCRCVGCLALHGMPVASPPVGPTLTMRLESMTSLSSAAVDTCSVVAFAWLNRGQ